MKNRFIIITVLIISGINSTQAQEKFTGRFNTGAETQSKWYKIATMSPSAACTHVSAQIKVNFMYVNTARRYEAEALVRIRKNSATPSDWQYSLNGFPTGQLKLKDLGNGQLEMYAFNLNSYGHFLTEITLLTECNSDIQVFNSPIEVDPNLYTDVAMSGTFYTSSTRLGINTINPTSSLHITDPSESVIRLQREAVFSEFGQNNAGGFLNLYNVDGQSNSILRSYGHTALNVVTGNVGIGTSTPDAKLTVKGAIHAQEVKVDLNGAVAPDYVFEPDYPLTTLTDLEVYLKVNKHLPEMPSAKEMEANGVNLLEMNMLLLKKVEELTLYVIKLNEGQLSLEKENEKLKADINKLNKDQLKSN